MKDALERELLLQIKRNWSKDEVVKALLLDKRMIEEKLGIVKSEFEEVKYKNRLLQIAIENYQTKIISLEGQVKSMRNTKKKYELQAIEWRDKYYSLKNMDNETTNGS